MKLTVNKSDQSLNTEMHVYYFEEHIYTRVSNKGPENLKTWKLETELEISSSSQVRFNHFQVQVWNLKNPKISSQVKFEKLQTWTRLINF